jgi:hypothetical protein
MSNSHEAKARAEASFKRKATKAWVEYEAQRRAVAEKTERFKGTSIGERGG